MFPNSKLSCCFLFQFYRVKFAINIDTRHYTFRYSLLQMVILVATKTYKVEFNSLRAEIHQLQNEAHKNNDNLLWKQFRNVKKTCDL